MCENLKIYQKRKSAKIDPRWELWKNGFEESDQREKLRKSSPSNIFLRHRKKVSRNGPKLIKNGQTIRGKHFYKFAFKIRRTFSGPFFGPFSGPFFGTIFGTIFREYFLAICCLWVRWVFNYTSCCCLTVRSLPQRWYKSEKQNINVRFPWVVILEFFITHRCRYYIFVRYMLLAVYFATYYFSITKVACKYKNFNT